MLIAFRNIDTYKGRNSNNILHKDIFKNYKVFIYINHSYTKIKHVHDAVLLFTFSFFLNF